MNHLQLERLAKALRERARKARALSTRRLPLTVYGEAVIGQELFTDDIRRRAVAEAYEGFAEEIEKLLEPVDGTFRL